MSEPGITSTRQVPAATAATVDLNGGTVTDLWRALFDHHEFRETVLRVLRAVAADRTVPELYDILKERDVPTSPDLPGWIRALGRGNPDAAWWLATEIPRLGSDFGRVDDLLAVAGLFDAVDTESDTPTVAVQLGDKFRGRRRDQRESILALLAALAQGRSEVDIAIPLGDWYGEGSGNGGRRDRMILDRFQGMCCIQGTQPAQLRPFF